MARSAGRASAPSPRWARRAPPDRRPATAAGQIRGGHDPRNPRASLRDRFRAPRPDRDVVAAGSAARSASAIEPPSRPGPRMAIDESFSGKKARPQARRLAGRAEAFERSSRVTGRGSSCPNTDPSLRCRAGNRARRCSPCTDRIRAEHETGLAGHRLGVRNLAHRRRRRRRGRRAACSSVVGGLVPVVGGCCSGRDLGLPVLPGLRRRGRMKPGTRLSALAAVRSSTQSPEEHDGQGEGCRNEESLHKLAWLLTKRREVTMEISRAADPMLSSQPCLEDAQIAAQLLVQRRAHRRGRLPVPP